MNAVEIVTASAGSGKTYHLAERLEKAVSSGQSRPDAIVATTFTNKAAAEIQERVRTRLLAAGRPEDAQALSLSRIGTVNAVCGRLVTDFAFTLGVSPRVEVIDEERAKVLLRSASELAISANHSRELAQICLRMDGLDWEPMVSDIVARARSNGLGAEELRLSAQRSKEGFAKLLGCLPAGETEDSIDASLRKSLVSFRAGVADNGDGTKKTATALGVINAALAQIDSGKQLAWVDWARLSKLETAKPSLGPAEVVQKAAQAHDYHPRLKADYARLIELLFEAAALTIQEYQEHKRAAGVIDFADQEVYALRLLKDLAVRQELQNQVDLVLVDEFQDTSPIQLAIFLELASLAKQTIWVGDQKQSIYGFRGSDPALMDGAVDQLMQGQEPHALEKSWRSRSDLVALTSELFAPPFGAHGIPEDRVKLRAARNEPAGLGPVVERWSLDSKNAENDQAAVAACVRQLLNDPDVRVRDPDSGEVRQVTPGDVAILCRKNEGCEGVAHALEHQGLRAAVGRGHLLTTIEGQVAFAALRLFVDPQNSLAAALLTRIVTYPTEPELWLTEVLRQPYAGAFDDAPMLRRIREARQANPLAGPVAALALAIEAVELRELCLRWGDSGPRLENVEQLRALAVAYVEQCVSAGEACTPAGLVAHFAALGAAGDDKQTALASPQAVNVVTWHAAKGLEWPIVVLFDLGNKREASALGVHVASDRAHLDVRAPRDGRWLRVWVNPFSKQKKGLRFHDRLDRCEETKAAVEAHDRQELRLLYVGWTRARDRVVLAARGGTLASGVLSRLRDAQGICLINEPQEQLNWAGVCADVVHRTGKPGARISRPCEPGMGTRGAASRSYPPAYVTPSLLQDTSGVVGQVLETETLGPRIAISGSPDMAALGNAVHGYFAAEQPELDAGDRVGLATAILQRWGVGTAVASAELVAAAEGLRRWAGKHWPGAIWRREWPLRHRLGDGTLMTGVADLVLELPESLVLVDHKSFPGTAADADQHAASHGGQLGAYAAALRVAMGRKVEACFIHLPLLGRVSRVEVAG